MYVIPERAICTIGGFFYIYTPRWRQGWWPLYMLQPLKSQVWFEGQYNFYEAFIHGVFKWQFRLVVLEEENLVSVAATKPAVDVQQYNERQMTVAGWLLPILSSHVFVAMVTAEWALCLSFRATEGFNTQAKGRCWVHIKIILLAVPACKRDFYTVKDTTGPFDGWYEACFIPCSSSVSECQLML